MAALTSLQDPVIVHETGLCVWQSGHRPVLDFKTSGSFLQGLLLLPCFKTLSHDKSGLGQQTHRRKDTVSVRL
jgi:hypothetical protein